MVLRLLRRQLTFSNSLRTKLDTRLNLSKPRQSWQRPRKKISKALDDPKPSTKKFSKHYVTTAEMVIPMSTLIRTYSELSRLKTFEERYRYLQLKGSVGKETFGFDRYLNQVWYQRNPKWKSARDAVIIRDNGCDLGIEGREIYGKIIVHHMNVITLEDLERDRDILYDPENLISTMHTTHNAIHYGDESLLILDPIERKPNDTCPWKF